MHGEEDLCRSRRQLGHKKERMEWMMGKRGAESTIQSIHIKYREKGVYLQGGEKEGEEREKRDTKARMDGVD